MYYGQIVADPKNPEKFYAADTNFRVSDDGGRTIRVLGDRNKHVDSHTIWVDPRNTDHIFVGCDSGIYESYDGGQFWQFKANLPTLQFYDVDIDYAKPFYNVYGGTQDNFSWGGPAATRNLNGIMNSDWYVTTGGDGFVSRVDPADADTVYAKSQGGGLVRYNRKTGSRINIKPIEAKGEPPLRWNWDAPLIVSPHNHLRLYFGANKLFRSDDRGNTWKAISPDLTRQPRSQRAASDGQNLGPGCCGEKRVDCVLRQHQRDFGIGQARRPGVHRDRRRSDSGSRRRRSRVAQGRPLCPARTYLCTADSGVAAR